MISDLDSFVEFAAPHIEHGRVLVVGTGSWMRSEGILPRLAELARSVDRVEVHTFWDRKPRRTFDAVVFYEGINAYGTPGVLIDRAAATLAADGRIVCEAFTPDRLDAKTVTWLVDRINERWPGRTSPKDIRETWELENEGMLEVSTDALMAALGRRFDQLALEPIPGLHLGDVLEFDVGPAEDIALADEVFQLEDAALAAGDITPVAFRYAGRRR